MAHEIDDPRRQWLIQALATGLFGAALPQAQAQGFSIFGAKPTQLPPGQSIYSIAGDVKVNDQAATLSTSIKPGDVLQTGANSQLIFVVNTHSMILRGDSRMVIEKPAQAPADNSVASAIIGGLRLITGKVLSVSRNSPMRVTTSTATIGIRGTGFYVESDPEQTYFCTCYGSTDVQATNDPDSKEQVTAAHHERPLYIVKDGGAGKNIRNAPFLNHSDQELSLIETLVGRKVPFVFSKDAYSAPRRNY
jgi:hypothetical protein